MCLTTLTKQTMLLRKSQDTDLIILCRIEVATCYKLLVLRAHSTLLSARPGARLGISLGRTRLHPPAWSAWHPLLIPSCFASFPSYYFRAHRLSIHSSLLLLGFSLIQPLFLSLHLLRLETTLFFTTLRLLTSGLTILRLASDWLQSNALLFTTLQYSFWLLCSSGLSYDPASPPLPSLAPQSIRQATTPISDRFCYALAFSHHHLIAAWSSSFTPLSLNFLLRLYYTTSISRSTTRYVLLYLSLHESLRTSLLLRQHEAKHLMLQKCLTFHP